MPAWLNKPARIPKLLSSHTTAMSGVSIAITWLMGIAARKRTLFFIGTGQHPASAAQIGHDFRSAKEQRTSEV